MCVSACRRPQVERSASYVEWRIAWTKALFPVGTTCFKLHFADGLAFYSRLCGCPIWDLPCVPARYDGEFRGRLLGPQGFGFVFYLQSIRMSMHVPADHGGDPPNPPSRMSDGIMCGCVDRTMVKDTIVVPVGFDFTVYVVILDSVQSIRSYYNISCLPARRFERPFYAWSPPQARAVQ